MRRLAAIDALRGVALLLMTFDHCFDWWLAQPYRDHWSDPFTEFLGTLSAPIFLLLVGVGLAFPSTEVGSRGAHCAPWHPAWCGAGCS